MFSFFLLLTAVCLWPQTTGQRIDSHHICRSPKYVNKWINLLINEYNGVGVTLREHNKTLWQIQLKSWVALVNARLTASKWVPLVCPDRFRGLEQSVEVKKGLFWKQNWVSSCWEISEGHKRGYRSLSSVFLLTPSKPAPSNFPHEVAHLPTGNSFSSACWLPPVQKCCITAYEKGPDIVVSFLCSTWSVGTSSVRLIRGCVIIRFNFKDAPKSGWRAWCLKTCVSSTGSGTFWNDHSAWMVTDSVLEQF